MSTREPRADALTFTTYWNGEPTPCRKVRAVVADDPTKPRYWAKDLVGTERDVVEVRYGDRVFYLDDAEGQGWDKVTIGHGGPLYPHQSLEVTDVRPRPKEDA